MKCDHSATIRATVPQGHPADERSDGLSFDVIQLHGQRWQQNTTNSVVIYHIVCFVVREPLSISFRRQIPPSITDSLALSTKSLPPETF